MDSVIDYFVEVVVKRCAPMAIVSVLAWLGTWMIAHAGMLESWGVNYIPDWSASWLTTHDISGPVILVELDTFKIGAGAAIVAAFVLFARAGEHHVMTTKPTPPSV